MTSGHRYKLLKQSVRVDACKFIFANRVCTAWNNLPATVVDSVIVHIFITRLNTAGLTQYCVVVYNLDYLQTLTVLYSVNLISRPSSKLYIFIIYIILHFVLTVYMGAYQCFRTFVSSWTFSPINVMLCCVLACNKHLGTSAVYYSDISGVCGGMSHGHSAACLWCGVNDFNIVLKIRMMPK